jgi:hypothetical protein
MRQLNQEQWREIADEMPFGVGVALGEATHIIPVEREEFQ